MEVGAGSEEMGMRGRRGVRRCEHTDWEVLLNLFNSGLLRVDGLGVLFSTVDFDVKIDLLSS